MTPYKQKLKQGFSLTEMLVTIATIGVIASIAIPKVSQINDASKDSVARVNAQRLAKVANVASEAGLDFVRENNGDLNQTLRAIVEGGHVDGGAFDGSFHGLPGLSDDAIENAKQYLVINNRTLLFTQNQQSDPQSNDSSLDIITVDDSISANGREK